MLLSCYKGLDSIGCSMVMIIRNHSTTVSRLKYVFGLEMMYDVFTFVFELLFIVCT